MNKQLIIYRGENEFLSRRFVVGLNGYEIIEQLKENYNENLKNIIAGVIEDKLVDLSDKINYPCTISFIDKDNPKTLEVIRHDTAHILAQAVKELYPEAQPTIGPVINNGFYYDFASIRPITTEDLELIEKRMHHIVKQNIKIIKAVWSKKKAIEYFNSINEDYKIRIIQDIEDDFVTVYKQGNFIDLCRGPHSPSTRFVKYFKLTKVSGAYWRGDHSNEMLQRIYGTAWLNKKDLDEYLFNIKEAEKRDHRKLGKQLSLFHFQNEAQGMVFWHPNGWTIYQIIKNYIRDQIEKDGYKEVNTPSILSQTLWDKSGHWDKFRENMFILTSEKKKLAIKPMNCPCHVQIFNQEIKSYRDLPLRIAEFGSCFRNEHSGALHGLMRVKAFVQDDAHIFCTESQINSETKKFCDLLKKIYKKFGFEKIKVKFSDRPNIRAGSDEVWDKSENSLKEAMDEVGIEYTLNPGEGAFYGPKLEFILLDSLKRSWQCGTLQVDFILPTRLNAEYVDSDGIKKTPVMLHRAILGSFERFIGILIEEYAGNFPLWLAPIQVVILTITNNADEYAKSIKKQLTNAKVRCELDITNEKISYKIHLYSQVKIPLMVILGKKEQETNTISVRNLSGDELKINNIEDLLLYMNKNI